MALKEFWAKVPTRKGESDCHRRYSSYNDELIPKANVCNIDIKVNTKKFSSFGSLVAVLHNRQYKAEFTTSLFLIHVAMVLQVLGHLSSTNMYHDQIECFLCLDHLK